MEQFNRDFKKDVHRFRNRFGPPLSHLQTLAIREYTAFCAHPFCSLSEASEGARKEVKNFHFTIIIKKKCIKMYYSIVVVVSSLSYYCCRVFTLFNNKGQQISICKAIMDLAFVPFRNLCIQQLFLEIGNTQIRPV